MKLKDWLILKNTTTTEFGARIGVTDASVRRYILGIRLPCKKVMPKIVIETKAAVTANDFYL